jgi:hypothetical protein
MRKFLKIIGIAVGFVLLLVPLEAQRQDAEYLAKLVTMDRSYSPTARVQAQQRLAALADANTVIPHAAFRVAMMEIAALADNGHTHVGSDHGADPMELPGRPTTMEPVHPCP